MAKKINDYRTNPLLLIKAIKECFVEDKGIVEFLEKHIKHAIIPCKMQSHKAVAIECYHNKKSFEYNRKFHGNKEKDYISCVVSNYHDIFDCRYDTINMSYDPYEFKYYIFLYGSNSVMILIKCLIIYAVLKII